MPVILALCRPRQEDRKFKTSLGCVNEILSENSATTTPSSYETPVYTLLTQPSHLLGCTVHNSLNFVSACVCWCFLDLLRGFSCLFSLSVPNYVVSQGRGLYLPCPLTLGRQTSAQHIRPQNREWHWLDTG